MVVHLPKDRYHVLHGDCRGHLIRCEAGIIWLTQRGDPDDHFLRPGEQFVINRTGTVIIEARRDARVVLASVGPDPNLDVPFLFFPPP